MQLFSLYKLEAEWNRFYCVVGLFLPMAWFHVSFGIPQVTDPGMVLSPHMYPHYHRWQPGLQDHCLTAELKCLDRFIFILPNPLGRRETNRGYLDSKSIVPSRRDTKNGILLDINSQPQVIYNMFLGYLLWTKVLHDTSRKRRRVP